MIATLMALLTAACSSPRGTWSAPDDVGHMILTLERGLTQYGLFAVDESSGRARLTI